jgi:N6-adenosine-specific RNA methylase IME4
MSQELVQFNKCKVSKVGLTFNEEMTFEEWQSIGLQLQLMHGSVGFWIGDWLNFGERKWGEKYAQAIEETGLDYGTLMNYVWVSKALPFSLRSENLSYSAHKEIAAAPEKERKQLIENSEGLTSREVKELVKEIKKLPTPPLPIDKYNCIVADPPWEYDIDLSTGATRSPENNYPVMNLEELCKFGEKVKEISADNCILFMWVTAPKLNWMNDILEAWGFEYKTNLIWDKVKPNMGHYSSVRHEILIIAGKGTCSPHTDGITIQSIDSVQSIEKSPRHSEKPTEFMEIIEKLYPDTKKIDLFSRKKREGWTTWGFDAEL